MSGNPILFKWLTAWIYINHVVCFKFFIKKKKEKIFLDTSLSEIWDSYSMDSYHLEKGPILNTNKNATAENRKNCIKSIFLKAVIIINFQKKSTWYAQDTKISIFKPVIKLFIKVASQKFPVCFIKKNVISRIKTVEKIILNPTLHVKMKY